MNPAKFKRGDKVRCVDTGAGGNDLTVGKVYEVGVDTRDGGVRLVRDDINTFDRFYFNERFELASEATPTFDIDARLLTLDTAIEEAREEHKFLSDLARHVRYAGEFGLKITVETV